MATRPARPVLLAAALVAGAGGSTLATALASAAAGRDADLHLQPAEFTIRVTLLLVAPCVGALLAAVAVPRGGGWPAAAAIGLGVPAGPLLVLRIYRVFGFGLGPALLAVGVLVVWAVIGGVLAAGWWGRPSRPVERTALPPVRPDGADPDELGPPRPPSRTAGGAPIDRGGAG